MISSNTSRIPFDLRELGLERVLDRMRDTDWGKLAFRDSAFRCIGDGLETVDLCESVARANLGPDA